MTATNVTSKAQPIVAAAKPAASSQLTSSPMPPFGKLRHLGIHGARGTGKTCYLACLYGHRATESGAVTFRDDLSIDYLKVAWNSLERGDVPIATALVLPTELNLSFHANGVGWNIITRDYAGVLVQRSERGVPELKEDVKKWLGSCHAILLFVNIDSGIDTLDSVLKERHDELDLLLTELKKLSSDGNTIGRPLALLLTKWDVRGELSYDPECERQRALEYLQSRPALKQIADALKNCGDRVELFPVSAFGSNRDGNKPPVDGPRPFGLHAPLAWAVQKADEMLLERARREADRRAGPHLRWWQRRYAKAVRCYRNLEKDHGINKGPTSERAWQEQNTWRTKLNKRRARQVTAVLVVLLTFTASGLLWHENLGHQRALAALADDSATYENVKRECDSYLTDWNPTSRWLGHNYAEIESRWKAYRQKREEEEYAALEAYRRENPGEEAAAKCDVRDKAFLCHWDSSAHAPTVEGWERDDRSLSEKFEANLRLEAAYHALLGSLEKLGERYDKLMAECDGFLKGFPETKYPKRVAIINDVKKRRDSYEEARNEKDWAQVVNYERQNPTNFDEIIRQTKDYANKPDARYRKEAQNMIARTEIRWDRTEYDKVRDAAREAKDAASLQAAEQAARRYMNGTHPRKSGAETVKKWLQWFDGFKDEKDYYFTIKSVLFPQDTELSNGRAAKIYGRFNSHAFDTGWGPEGDNPQFDRKVGPVRFKWGDLGVLEITVQRQYGWTLLHKVKPFSDYLAVGKVENDRFLLSKTHGSFVVTYNTTNVTVYFDCPEAVGPTLSAYPDK